MPGRQFFLLISEELKNHLLTLTRKERERIREKFDFLENGLWDSGLVVKKLKGPSSKVLFEARVSRGERLLFTLGPIGEMTGVYVWGIVKHDDISRTARTVIPDNAPFLQFEPDATEEYEELGIDELPQTYHTQENFHEQSTEDSGPQKWYTLTEAEWKRVLLYSGDEDFDIHLFLTPQQREILNRQPPLLLSGTACSTRRKNR